jgi:negative regulator of flagellin synthesis FlgM
VSSANTSPDVRADKVRDLKEQVQAGTYKPDIRKAAANLLRDEVSLTK